MATFEKIHAFTIEGQEFYIMWKEGGCLLRTIESVVTNHPTHRTIVDMFVTLFDNSTDYELTAHDAIVKAPSIAENLINRLREQEVHLMKSFYASKDQQLQHPEYEILELPFRGEQYPLIWGNHNCNTYVRVKGDWFFSNFATSLNEAKDKTQDFILYKTGEC